MTMGDRIKPAATWTAGKLDPNTENQPDSTPQTAPPRTGDPTAAALAPQATDAPDQ